MVTRICKENLCILTNRDNQIEKWFLNKNRQLTEGETQTANRHKDAHGHYEAGNTY